MYGLFIEFNAIIYVYHQLGHDGTIKMHNDLLHMSLLVSDRGISHMIHPLITGEENFSTVVGQLLSKSEAMGADTCHDNSNSINNRAENASNSSGKR